MTTTNFSHSGNIGDIWASLPTIYEYFRKTGKRAILYLKINVPAKYYEGAVHPTKNDDGSGPVMLNTKMVEMMMPLLLEQECIAEVKIWKGEKIQVPLEAIRETHVGMPNLSINRWYFYVFPDLACDLSKKWLTVPDSEIDFAKGKIIITLSERYRNDRISYEFLKPYEEDLLFCGTMREYNTFCMANDLNVRKLNITSFLQLAQAIKQSRFHISNQTQAYQLSTGLKHPSILEVCDFAPNVIPIGEDQYDFFAQEALEYYFKLLHKKTASKEAVTS